MSMSTIRKQASTLILVQVIATSPARNKGSVHNNKYAHKTKLTKSNTTYNLQSGLSNSRVRDLIQAFAVVA
jgi:hypothetical protein